MLTNIYKLERKETIIGDWKGNTSKIGGKREVLEDKWKMLLRCDGHWKNVSCVIYIFLSLSLLFLSLLYLVIWPIYSEILLAALCYLNQNLDTGDPE